MLVRARVAIAALPFERWRASLGGAESSASNEEVAEAAKLAAHVEWAARRVPFETKCLPRAMALSWLLRARGIGHTLVFAVRPPAMRGSTDGLHAWVDVGGRIILGELPGPWVETLRLA